MPSTPHLVPEEILSGGIKRTSPTDHLKALRAPGNTKSKNIPILETGQYLSPFLHNVSDTWVRHLRKKSLRCIKDPYPERRPENANKIDRASSYRLRTWSQNVRQHSQGFLETIADNGLEKALKTELQTRAGKIEDIMKQSWAIGRHGEMGDEFRWHPLHWFDIRLQLREETKAEEPAPASGSRSGAAGEPSLLSSNWLRNSSFFKNAAASYWKSPISESPIRSDNDSVFSKSSDAGSDVESVDISIDKSPRADKPAVENGKLPTSDVRSSSTNPEPWMEYGPTIGQARRNKFISDLRAAREEVFPKDYGWQRPPLHYIHCEEVKRKDSPGFCGLAYIISLFVRMAEEGITFDSPSPSQAAYTVVFSGQLQKSVNRPGPGNATPESVRKFITSVVNRSRLVPEYIHLRSRSSPYLNLKFKHEYMVDALIPGSEVYESREEIREYYEKKTKTVRSEVGKKEKNMYRCFESTWNRVMKSASRSWIE